MKSLRGKLEKAVDNYNKYRKVRVNILHVKKNGFVARFTGENLCYTCCLYDWFEDLIYEIEDDKPKFKVSKIEKISDSEYHVEYSMETE